MTSETKETEFVFETSDLESIPVTIGTDKYTLLEASGTATSAYKNSMMKDVVFNRGNISKIRNMADADYVLLASCLIRHKVLANDTVKDKQVPVEVVKKWKEKICKKLVDWIKKTSGIGTDESVNQIALKTILSRTDAPIKYELLQDWVLETFAESDVPEEMIAYELFEDAEEVRKNV